MRTSFFLLSLLLILAACTERTLTIAESIAVLKETCNSACGNAEQAITLHLPEGSEIYTTTEAICIAQKEHARLSCGTCSCETYGLAGGLLVLVPPSENITCVFSDAGESLDASCA